ncbi:MAG: CrcB family protein [Microbacteriaceae bacterium]|nr:CrcB family protein [Microbacteriaceae bacterium]
MTDLVLVISVALAGGAGAAVRQIVHEALKSTSERMRFPIWLMLVNITGSFGLGFILGFPFNDPYLVTVLTVGFFGGYTTFSTASLDTTKLLKERRVLAGVIYAFGMLLLCAIAAYLGYQLAS